MRITINWARCEGNGVCAFEAPEVFAIHDDGLELLDEHPSDGQRRAVELAEAQCPRQAILVED